MQRTFEHIATFVELLRIKGYDGMFQSSFGFTDKLKDNLTKHVFQCFEEKKNIGPLNLTTYSQWIDDKSPYVRCNFFTDFSEPRGFNVLKMNIEYGNEFGVIRQREIPVNNHREIPERKDAIKSIIEHKKGIKI
jgi:hypothetical protein